MTFVIKHLRLYDYNRILNIKDTCLQACLENLEEMFIVWLKCLVMNMEKGNPVYSTKGVINAFVKLINLILIVQTLH